MDRAALLADAADAAAVPIEAVEQSMAEVAEPFDLLLRSLTDDAALTAAGRAFTHGWLVRLLAGRTRLDAAVRADPGLAAETIEAPLIVAGAPRTGTTYLHGLLAQHPDLRAPEGWELLFPAPPPAETVADDDPRIAAADEELTWPQRQNDSMLSIHRYAGRMHKECLSAMSFAFRREEFVRRYRVPRYVEWLAGGDMTPAYEMHRLVLRCLQRHRSSRWVLKSPVHLNNLPTVLATYPDARIVITHREPHEVLGSVTSLVANLRRAFSDAVDETEIARYHLDLYGRSLDALVDADLMAASVVHVDQHDLIRDPQGVLDHLCSRWDLARVTVDGRPPVEAGHHEYALAGVTAAEVDERFARYRARFLP